MQFFFNDDLNSNKNQNSKINKDSNFKVTFNKVGNEKKLTLKAVAKKFCNKCSELFSFAVKLSATSFDFILRLLSKLKILFKGVFNRDFQVKLKNNLSLFLSSANNTLEAFKENAVGFFKTGLSAESYRAIISTNKSNVNRAYKNARVYMKRRIKSAKRYAEDVKNRPIIAMGATIAAVSVILFVMSANFSLAFEVVVSGKTIATVHSKDEYNKALDEVNEQLAYHFGDEGKIQNQAVIVPRLVTKDNFTSDEQLKNSIKALSDKMIDGYMLYADDEPLFAMVSEEEINQALDNFKACYTGNNKDVSVEFGKSIAVKPETVPVVMIYDVEGAVNLLNGSDRKDLEYTIKSGDTLWSISRKFGLTEDQLKSINPGLTENIDIDQKILVKAFVPIIDVITSQQVAYNREIPYETEKKEDSSLYKGTTKVDQKGKNGEEAVVANVIKKNGLETERVILESNAISEPVTEIKRIGTKKPPSGYGTGKFIMPTYGTISSRFGMRHGSVHKGLDIAAPSGTPIRAADNGRVTFSGWKGLFGRLVIIDHLNGYVTYYGHCSSLNVKAGQTVNKGDIIAYVGSTGNSTGPHLHFEVYCNGNLVNPEKLPY